MRAQEVIGLMRQNADSLDKLGTYPLNAKQLFGGDCVISEYFYDSGNYYEIGYLQHLEYYDNILAWLDYNKPGVVNTLEREHNRVLDHAKAVDQHSKEIKFIYMKQFPDIVKAKDPSLDPEKFKKEIKDDHAFRIGLFTHAASKMAEKFRNIAKQLETECISGSLKETAMTNSGVNITPQFMSVAGLAEAYDLSDKQKEALRKRLERLRRNNMLVVNQNIFRAVNDTGPRQPQFLYNCEKAKLIIENLKAKMSGERPAKKKGYKI